MRQIRAIKYPVYFAVVAAMSLLLLTACHIYKHGYKPHINEHRAGQLGIHTRHYRNILNARHGIALTFEGVKLRVDAEYLKAPKAELALFMNIPKDSVKPKIDFKAIDVVYNGRTYQPIRVERRTKDQRYDRRDEVITYNAIRLAKPINLKTLPYHYTVYFKISSATRHFQLYIRGIYANKKELVYPAINFSFEERPETGPFKAFFSDPAFTY